MSQHAEKKESKQFLLLDSESFSLKKVRAYPLSFVALKKECNGRKRIEQDEMIKKINFFAAMP